MLQPGRIDRLNEIVEDFKKGQIEHSQLIVQLKTDLEKEKDENVKLKQDFSMRLNNLEQRTRINNIEIVGLKKPSLMQTDASMSLKLLNDIVGVETSQGDLEALHEVPSKRKDNKRIVVVHFKSRFLRDTVLEKSKAALREYNSNRDIAERVYLNEQLSPENKRLFAQTIKIKHELNFKFVWSKNGKIFFKQDESPSSQFYKITCQDDIDKIVR